MAKTQNENENVGSGDLSLPLVIVNPRSASGSTHERWAQTASELRTHFGAFSVAFTRSPGDASTLAESAARSGREFIIACGGDGTINEVANGILHSGANAELGVLPSGTGGDFRRTIGMPRAIREGAAALRDGITKTMDVGKVSFTDLEDRPTDRFFLNVSSVGLAALIIDRVKTTTSLGWLPASSLRGRASFAVSALQKVIGQEPFNIRVRIDHGEEKTVRTLSFCIANARYFGGGMMIAPDASINDGLLDVVNIGDISTARILLNAYTLYRGTHQKLEQVESKSAARVEVRAFDDTDRVLIETDGELPGKLPAIFEIVPSALRIRIPAPKPRR